MSQVERVNGQQAVTDAVPGRKIEPKQVFVSARFQGSGRGSRLDRDVQDWQTAGPTVLITKAETLD